MLHIHVCARCTCIIYYVVDACMMELESYTYAHTICTCTMRREWQQGEKESLHQYVSTYTYIASRYTPHF